MKIKLDKSIFKFFTALMAVFLSLKQVYAKRGCSSWLSPSFFPAKQYLYSVKAEEPFPCSPAINSETEESEASVSSTWLESGS